MTLRERIRDWWRGYSDADIASLRAKFEANRRPYAVIPVTNAEMRALNDGHGGLTAD